MSICSSTTNGEHWGFFQLMELKERASNILGRKADITTRDSLHKTLRQHIEAGAVLVF